MYICTHVCAYVKHTLNLSLRIGMVVEEGEGVSSDVGSSSVVVTSSVAVTSSGTVTSKALLQFSLSLQHL